MTRLVVDVMESSDYISRRICSSYPVCGRWTLDGRFTVIYIVLTFSYHFLCLLLIITAHNGTKNSYLFLFSSVLIRFLGSLLISKCFTSKETFSFFLRIFLLRLSVSVRDSRNIRRKTELFYQL